MVKPAARAYSRYSQDAITLMGQLIRKARIERKLTVAELAERAGVARGLVQRIEKGDPGCSIGAVFEAAAIVGLRLFDAGRATLSDTVETSAAMLTLLPKAVRPSSTKAQDDF